ncbi:MAG: HNH endonuclease [Actinomycetota bacterium]
MKAFVGVTDRDWFEFLKARPDLDEVNFWQPSGGRAFRAISPGEPFLFKLHYPANAIVGGGTFLYKTDFPASIAWEAFQEKNGAPTYAEMRRRIERYRRVSGRPTEDYTVGCLILRDPFFLPEDDWVSPPPDWRPNIVQGKTYNLDSEIGRDLWAQVLARREMAWAREHPLPEKEVPPMYGDPVQVRSRLGQGAFRLLVTDTYQRRCAITREKALPVLEAAHIRPVSEGGLHEVANGLLFRSDVHTLFDRGYVTVTPKYEFRVSRRLKDEFDNGEHYYALEGQELWLPGRPDERPSPEQLEWHADTMFLG